MESSTGTPEQALPYLQVTGPDGASFQVAIPSAGPLPIGRAALGSDPHVSRVHCMAVYRNSELIVTDNNSKNGTLVFHHGEWRWLSGSDVHLQDGDVIRIPGGVPSTASNPGQPGFWDLVFHDPLATRPVDFLQAIRWLEFDAERERFFRSTGGNREDLGLTPGSQEYRLLRYMLQRLTAARQASIDCTHDELIAAIWEGSETHARTSNDVAHLIRNLRLRVEPTPTRPRFLVTLRGGYRLIVRPLPDLERLDAG